MRQEKPPGWHNNLKRNMNLSAGNFYLKVQKEGIRAENLRKAKYSQIQSVFNEDDSEEEVNKIVQKKQLSFEINRAYMTHTPLDGLIAIKKYLLPGTREEKIKTLQDWLQEFFLEKSQINLEEDYLSARIDIGLLSEPTIINPTKLIVFGVDFLSTAQIINKYTKFNPQLAWIDSSHCLFTFESVDLASVMIRQCKKDKSTVRIVEEPDILCREWVELQGYLNLTFRRRIFIRSVAEKDQLYLQVLPKNPEPFNRYKSALRSLQIQLLKDPKIREIFESNLQEQMAAKMISPSEFRKRKMATIQKMDTERDSFMGQSHFRTKQKEYQNQMLKRIRKPEELGDQRYTLKFYSEFMAADNPHNRRPQYNNTMRNSNPDNRGQDRKKSFSRSSRNNGSMMQEESMRQQSVNSPTQRNNRNNWKQRQFIRKKPQYDTANASKLVQTLSQGPLFNEHHISNRKEDNELDSPIIQQNFLNESIVAKDAKDLEQLLRNIESEEEGEELLNNKFDKAVSESQILRDLEQQLPQESRAGNSNIKKQAIVNRDIQRQKSEKGLPNFSQISSISQKSHHLGQFPQSNSPLAPFLGNFGGSPIQNQQQLIQYLNESSYSSWLQSVESSSNPGSSKSKKDPNIGSGMNKEDRSSVKSYNNETLQKMISLRRNFQEQSKRLNQVQIVTKAPFKHSNQKQFPLPTKDFLSGVNPQQ